MAHESPTLESFKTKRIFRIPSHNGFNMRTPRVNVSLIALLLTLWGRDVAHAQSAADLRRAAETAAQAGRPRDVVQAYTALAGATELSGSEVAAWTDALVTLDRFEEALAVAD